MANILFKIHKLTWRVVIMDSSGDDRFKWEKVENGGKGDCLLLSLFTGVYAQLGRLRETIEKNGDGMLQLRKDEEENFYRRDNHAGCSVTEVRKQVAMYIKLHKKFFSNFLNPKFDVNIDSYVHLIAKEGALCDNMFIAAFASMVGVRVKVMDKGSWRTIEANTGMETDWDFMNHGVWNQIEELRVTFDHCFDSTGRDSGHYQAMVHLEIDEKTDKAPGMALGMARAKEQIIISDSDDDSEFFFVPQKCLTLKSILKKR